MIMAPSLSGGRYLNALVDCEAVRCSGCVAEYSVWHRTHVVSAQPVDYTCIRET